MKLNKKGYMLVEIIVSFVLAISISLFLLNLTLKFKDTNEDIYYSINYSKDKMMITKGIMEDIIKGTVTTIEKEKRSNNYFELVFYMYMDDSDVVESRKLIVDNKTIEYGKFDLSNNNFIKTDISYYKKKLENSLMIGEVTYEFGDVGNFFSLNIPINSMYKDEAYDIVINVPRNKDIYLSNTVNIGDYVKYLGDSSWRVAYVKDGMAHLISKESVESVVGSSLNMESADFHATYLKNYCNAAHVYVENTSFDRCAIDNKNIWYMNEDDFYYMTGKKVADCLNVSSNDCGKNKDLINIGSNYWIGGKYWNGSGKKVIDGNSSSTHAIRPIVKLDARLNILSGEGTEGDPFVIPELSKKYVVGVVPIPNDDIKTKYEPNETLNVNNLDNIQIMLGYSDGSKEFISVDFSGSISAVNNNLIDECTGCNSSDRFSVSISENKVLDKLTNSIRYTVTFKYELGETEGDIEPSKSANFEFLKIGKYYYKKNDTTPYNCKESGSNIVCSKWTGFYKDSDGYTYRLVDGAKQNGWYKDSSGNWYYFLRTTGSGVGRASTHEQNIGYISGVPENAMLTGRWVKIYDNNKKGNPKWFWYYFDSSGKAVKGWKTIGGQKYYFNESTEDDKASDWNGPILSMIECSDGNETEDKCNRSYEPFNFGGKTIGFNGTGYCTYNCP